MMDQLGCEAQSRSPVAEMAAVHALTGFVTPDVVAMLLGVIRPADREWVLIASFKAELDEWCAIQGARSGSSSD